MSRLEEAEAAIYDEGTTPTGYWADVLALARTLAAEVDELTTRRMETIAMSDQLAEELAAANDTLAALRLVVPPHGYWPIGDDTMDNLTRKIDAILYTEGRDND